MRSPPIRGLVESSLTHWRGKIASVIFVGGCTLRCPRCPAPHLVTTGDHGAIPLDAVLDTVYRRRRWIEGVVVKGGEPLSHPELPDLLELLRDFGLMILLETNGTRPEELKRVIAEDLVDVVAMELKAPLTDLYPRIAGTPVCLGDLFESIETLLSGRVDHEFRTPVYGELLEEEDVLAIARTIRGANRYVLRAVPGLGPSRARLRNLARRAGRHVKACHVDGRPQDRGALSTVFTDGDEGIAR